MTAISYLVGLLLQRSPTLVAAFTPWVIFAVCVVGLLCLVFAASLDHYAKEIDKALDFGPSSDDAEKQPLIERPSGNGSDITTNTGGGVTSRRPS